jgi:hypothetical protein
MVAIFIHLYILAMTETEHSVPIQGGRVLAGSSPIALAMLFTLELPPEQASRGDRKLLTVISVSGGGFFSSTRVVPRTLVPYG